MEAYNEILLYIIMKYYNILYYNEILIYIIIYMAS